MAFRARKVFRFFEKRTPGVEACVCVGGGGGGERVFP